MGAAGAGRRGAACLAGVADRRAGGADATAEGSRRAAAHRELKARWWSVFDEVASAAEARAGLQAIVADYHAAYPSAMAVIERDLDQLVTHLRFPGEHRKWIRSTKLLERTFVEVRRRTKIVGRFPGETSALSLIWAVLELSSRGWRGVTMTPRAVAQIERIRRGHRSPPTRPPQQAPRR